MKLWNRIKYELFGWLLDDICRKSDCADCTYGRTICIHGHPMEECVENDLYVQARKVWKIE